MNLFFDAPSLSATAEAQGLIQLNWPSLAMNLLNGKFQDGRHVGNDDVRSNDPDWQVYFEGSVARSDYTCQLDPVRELITIVGRTLARGALCWLLAKSSHTLPLPGAKTAQQAEENAATMEYGPPAISVMQEIEAVLKRPLELEARAR